MEALPSVVLAKKAGAISVIEALVVKFELVDQDGKMIFCLEVLASIA